MPCFCRRIFDVPNFTQQAYRYGISFACLGVLLNWLGVAQVYMGPVRYLGIGLVLFGSFLIITSMCRWLYKAISQNSAQNLESELNSVNVNELLPLHVIDVPLEPLQSGYSGNISSIPAEKPPDYCVVVENPPSYEEAILMRPYNPMELNLTSLPVIHSSINAQASTESPNLAESSKIKEEEREVLLPLSILTSPTISLSSESSTYTASLENLDNESQNIISK